MLLQYNYLDQCLIVWILFKPINLNGTMGKQPRTCAHWYLEPLTCDTPFRKHAAIRF